MKIIPNIVKKVKKESKKSTPPAGYTFDGKPISQTAAAGNAAGKALGKIFSDKVIPKANSQIVRHLENKERELDNAIKREKLTVGEVDKIEINRLQARKNKIHSQIARYNYQTLNIIGDKNIGVATRIQNGTASDLDKAVFPHVQKNAQKRMQKYMDEANQKTQETYSWINNFYSNMGDQYISPTDLKEYNEKINDLYSYYSAMEEYINMFGGSEESLQFIRQEVDSLLQTQSMVDFVSEQMKAYGHQSSFDIAKRMQSYKNINDYKKAMKELPIRNAFYRATDKSFEESDSKRNYEFLQQGVLGLPGIEKNLSDNDWTELGLNELTGIDTKDEYFAFAKASNLKSNSDIEKFKTTLENEAKNNAHDITYYHSLRKQIDSLDNVFATPEGIAFINDEAVKNLIKTYRPYTLNPDYAQYARPIDSENKSNMYQEIESPSLRADSPKKGGLPAGFKVGEDTEYLLNLDKSEKEMYFYLYNTRGEAEANEFIDKIMPILENREKIKEYQKLYNFGKNHPILALGLNTALSVGDAIISPLESGFAYVSGTPVSDDGYTATSEFFKNATVQGAVSNSDSEVGKYFYKGLTEVAGLYAQFKTAQFLGAPFTAMKGAEYGRKATSIINAAIQGSQVANTTMLQYKKEGASDKTAMGMGLMNAFIEGITEKIAWNKILKTPNIILNSGSKELVASIAKKIGYDAFTEGSEEVVSSWLQSLAAFITKNNQHDELTKAFDNYTSQGMSETEAFLRAVWDTAPEYAEEFLVAGFAGGMFSSTNTMQYKKTVDTVRTRSSNFFADFGASKNAVQLYLMQQGIENPEEIAKYTNAIIDTSDGKKLDADTENEIRDNPVFQGVMYGYLDARVEELEKEKAVKEKPKITEKTPRQHLAETLSNLSNKNAETVINDASLKAEFENTVGIKIEGTKSEQRALVKDNASKFLEVYNPTVKDSGTTKTNAVSDSNVGRIGNEVYVEFSESLTKDFVNQGLSEDVAKQRANTAFDFMYNQGKNGMNKNVAINAASEMFGAKNKATYELFYTAGAYDNANALKGKEGAKLVVNDTLKRMRKTNKAFSYGTERAINAIAGRLGFDIEFVDEIEGGANASFDTATGVFKVSAKSKNPFLTAVIHEGVHAGRSVDAKSYNKLANVVAEILGKDTNVLGKAFSNRLSVYKKEATGADGKINSDLITEEMIAEVVSHVVSGDAEFINALASQDRGIVKRIFDVVKDLFEKITKRYTGEAKGELSPEMKSAVYMLKKEQAKVVKAFEKVLDATETKQGKEVKGAEIGKKSVEKHSGLMYNKDYWRTDLNKNQLKRVEQWIRKAGFPESKRITDTACWYKGRIDGEDLFVIYSTEDANNPTILYEIKGQNAQKELDILYDVMEVVENGKSHIGIQRNIDRLFGGDWLQEKHNLANNNVGSRKRIRNSGYASVLQGESSEFIGSQAFRNVVKNLYDIQEKTGVLKSKPEIDTESEVSKASISIPPVLNLDAEVQAKLNELVEKYGKINKSSDVNIPKAVSDEKAVRKHAATEIESEVVSREGANTLAEMILRGDKAVTYHPVSNDELLRRAQANIDAVGYENAIIRWLAWAESDKRIMPINIAEADLLIVEAQKRGDTDNYIKLITTLPMISTNHAQVLQAFSIIKKLPGVDANKVVDDMIGKMQLIKNRHEGKRGKTAKRIVVDEELREDYIKAKDKEIKESEERTRKAKDKVSEKLKKFVPDMSQEEIDNMIDEGWNEVVRFASIQGEPDLDFVLKQKQKKIYTQSEMDNLQSEFDKASSELEAEIEKLDDSNSEFKEMKKQIKSLKNRTETAKSRLEKIESEYGNLEDEMLEAEVAYNEAMNEYNDAVQRKKDVTKAKNLAKAAKEMADNAQKRAAIAEEKLSEYREAYEKARLEYIDWVNQIDSLKSQTKMYKTYYKDKTSKLSSAQNRAKKWAEKLNAAIEDANNVKADFYTAWNNYLARKAKRESTEKHEPKGEKAANLEMVGLKRGIERMQEVVNEKFGFNKDGTPKVKIDIDVKVIEEYGGAILDETLGRTTKTESQVILEKISQQIADQVPATIWEKERAFRYFAMLSNPRTHIKNMASNAAMALVTMHKNLMAVMTEQTLGRAAKHFEQQKLKGLDSRSKNISWRFKSLRKKNNKLYQFAMKDVEELRSAIQGSGSLDGGSGVNVMSSHEILRKRKIFSQHWWSKLYNNKVSRAIADGMLESKREWVQRLGKRVENVINKGVLESASKLNSALLEAEDWIFSKRHYKNALTSYLAANNINVDTISEETLRKAREYAMSEAQRATFRENVKAAAALNQVSKISPLFGFFTDALVPFKKTPVNILRRGIEYSPYSLIKGLTKGLYDVKNGNISVAQWCDTLAQGFTGTQILLIGMLGFAKGFISGGNDDEETALKNKLFGEQTYSLKIGGFTYTIDWLSPASMPLFMGYNLAKAFDDDDLEISDAFDFVASLASAMPDMLGPLVDMSMLQGLTNAFQEAKYAEDDVGMILNFVKALPRQWFAQYIPSALKAFTKTIDPIKRNTYYVDKTSKVPEEFQRYLNTFMAAMPGLSDNLEPSVNVKGEVMKNAEGNIFSRAIQNFISPGYYKSIKSSVVDEELARLYGVSDKASNIIPRKQKQYIQANGERIDLSAEQYTEYSQIAGQTYYEKLKEVISSDYYKGLSDDDKISLLSKARDYAEDKAKESIVDGYLMDTGLKNGFETSDGYKYMIKEAKAESFGEDDIPKDNRKQYNEDRINLINSMLDIYTPNSNNYEFSTTYMDSLYEFAKYEAMEKNSDGGFLIANDAPQWVYTMQQLQPEQRVEYLKGRGIMATEKDAKKSRLKLLVDDNISDEVKVYLIGNSTEKNYDVHLKHHNVPASVWLAVKNKYDTLNPIEKPGADITKKEQVCDYINSLKLSNEQKSALFRACGYKDYSESPKGKPLEYVDWSYVYDGTVMRGKLRERTGTVISNVKSEGFTRGGTFNNDADAGQCVWYARGRAYEIAGANVPALGNANQIYANAKDSAKLDPTVANIRQDIFVCYQVGTSATGQTAGHVIYIEGVDGNIVYYTENKSGGMPAGTLKWTTAENLLKGKSGNGATIGTDCIGFVDVTKY